MKRALDIAIAGYGIAGIAAAIQLRRAGHRITHFERKAPPVADGAGMLLHAAAQRQLDRLSVLAAARELGSPVTRIFAQTVAGRPLMDFRYGDLIAGQSGLGIQRGALHRLLANADEGRAQVLAGCGVDSISPDTGWLVDEHQGRHGPFDLIVVADGMHSRLRGQIGVPSVSRQSASAAAVVGLFDSADGSEQGSLAQYFDGVRHMSVWPAGRAAPGEAMRCGLAINVSMREAESLRSERPDAVWLGRIFPAFRRLIGDRAGPMNLRVISYREVELRRSCIGRVAMIGDAAHSMSPLLGTGAQLALEDAATLARVLDAHREVSEALLSFGQLRGPQQQRHHLASRWLSKVLQSESGALALVRDRLFGKAMAFPLARRMAHELMG